MEHTEHTQETPDHGPHAHLRIEILVNEHEVVVHEHRLTGLQIKEAAIAQHVPIHLDAVLSEDRPHHRPKIIGDRDEVTVHQHSKFHAVCPDDNS